MRWVPSAGAPVRGDTTRGALSDSAGDGGIFRCGPPLSPNEDVPPATSNATATSLRTPKEFTPVHGCFPSSLPAVLTG